MRPRHPYIVIHPAMPTNTTGVFLVVHTDEWVAVSLGEKDAYAFTSEHPDYTSADTERIRLNQHPAKYEPWTSTETENETPEKTGVSLTRTARGTPDVVTANS